MGPKERQPVGNSGYCATVLTVGLYNPMNTNDTRGVFGSEESDKECLESHNLRALKFKEQSHVNCSMELFSHKTAPDMLLDSHRD